MRSLYPDCKDTHILAALGLHTIYTRQVELCSLSLQLQAPASEGVYGFSFLSTLFLQRIWQ